MSEVRAMSEVRDRLQPCKVISFFQTIVDKTYEDDGGTQLLLPTAHKKVPGPCDHCSVKNTFELDEKPCSLIAVI